MDFLLYPIVICAGASFALAKVLVLTASQHGRFTMDLPGAVQKVHHTPTPRIGGVGIYIALVFARAWMTDAQVTSILDTILIAGIPALAVGLLEDVTKRVSIRARLAATVGSGVLATALTGIAVGRLDLPLADPILAAPLVAALFTALAVGGVANAINIIDGFNGLASGATTIALLAIAAVAHRVGDAPLCLAAIVLAAAVVGFWLVNFPWGKLFLGDGGAYFAGFALAWLAVLLPARNPTVSPWTSLLICGYPVIEVVYSVTRRWYQRVSAAHADRGHLHSLVATRLVQRRLRGLEPTLQNAAVSVVMWICAAIPALLAVTSYAQTEWLIPGAVGSVLLYHWLYRYVART